MTTAPLHRLSALAVRDAVARGEVRASDVAEDVLSRIHGFDSKVRAFLRLDEDGARASAKAVDAKIAAKKPLGRLAGVTVAVKDVLCTRGVETTCASKILKGFVPPYDAHVVERLRAEDAILVGKTNLDEFAMGSSTENSAFHVTANPWDLSRVPGGSSGGSAAAIAADFAHLALGTDTGGSIRQPAALCGMTGLKPTYGRVSRYGLIAFASSLDQIGPMTGDVRDAALLLSVIAGRDARDSTSQPAPVPDYLASIEDGVKGFRLGVPREYFPESIQPAVRDRVRDAIDVYERLGAEIVDVSLPHTDYGIAAYYIVATSEASSNLARYDGVQYGIRADGARSLVEMTSRTRTQGFGPEVTRRILLGTYCLSSGYYDAYYLKGLRIRTLLRRDFDSAFAKVDAILCPTSPIPAFKIGEKVSDPLSMYLCDVFSVTANLAGIPGISIQCGFTAERLPVGLQVLGKPLGEETILRVARAYERETDWHLQRPPLD
ncbi:MAG: Asp-tRNA(Asn)/Glu-tRNA(Gln) amidotransferase subunit GatA [Planctomycetes bacterium]|nr:Asp-tRNA(Asn)/Glu-tRNA(Gln) amidotransferase subunit GatA [Planctomycetota bacterium]